MLAHVVYFPPLEKQVVPLWSKYSHQNFDFMDKNKNLRFKGFLFETRKSEVFPILPESKN
jgi:hypothetical protein